MSTIRLRHGLPTPHNGQLLLIALLAGLGCQPADGEPGPAGATGPQGPAGPGVTGMQIVYRNFAPVPALPVTNTVQCPPGKRVISGGYAVNLTTVQVGQSFPLNSADGWGVSTFNGTGAPFALTIIAICGDIAMGAPVPVAARSLPEYRQP